VIFQSTTKLGTSLAVIIFSSALEAAQENVSFPTFSAVFFKAFRALEVLKINPIFAEKLAAISGSRLSQNWVPPKKWMVNTC